MNIKKRQNIGVDLYVHNNTTVSTVSLSWRDVGITHVSPNYVHVYD